MKNTAWFLLAIIFCKIGFAQDPLFTSTNLSLVSLNPSYAGSSGLFRNQTALRNQWPDRSYAYSTFNTTADVYLKKIKSGIALYYSHDDQSFGTIKTDAIGLAYSRPFAINERLSIIPSLQANYFRKTLNATQLVFGNQISSTGQVPQQSSNYAAASSKENINLSSGLIVNYKHFYFGAAIFNINQPDEGVIGASKLPYRVSLHASYNLLLSEKTLVHFFARYEKQQTFYYYQFNTSCVVARHFIFGVGYKYSSSPYVLAGYRHNLFAIQLNFEKYISGAGTYAYEIAASFNLRPKDQRRALVDFERW